MSEIYLNYYTHDQLRQRQSTTALKRAYAAIEESYLASRFGYLRLRKRYSSVLGSALYLMPIRRLQADYSVLALRQGSGHRLLDVGCGSGEFLLRMKRLGWSVFGIDTDPKVVEDLQQRGLNVEQGNLAAAPFEAASFDVIALSHVIEHVEAPVELLRQCAYLLRPGGKLVILTPNVMSLGHKIFRRYWRGLEPPRHFFLFSTRTLRECAARAGLQEVKSTTTARWARNIVLASLKIRRKERRTGNSFVAKVWGRLYAYVFAMIEILGVSLRFKVGEELVYVGTVRNAQQ